MARKVVLFIVEGLSDQNALDPIISEIVNENTIRFEVTHGDITSNYTRNTALTIVEEIMSIVNKFLTKRSFHVDDLLEVILLTDTDGTFIKTNNVKQHTNKHVHYNDTEILTRNVSEIQMRNIIKSQILEKISNMSEIEIRNKSVPFTTFYMSCNLDHVLFDDRNMSKNKLDKALKFADSYEGREAEFIDFIKQFMINIDDNYNESWESIKETNNSLLRYSNLWLYLKKYK